MRPSAKSLETFDHVQAPSSGIFAQAPWLGQLCASGMQLFGGIRAALRVQPAC
jgi:hypothetical protein